MSPTNSRFALLICVIALTGCIATITEEEAGDGTASTSGRVSAPGDDGDDGDDPPLTTFADGSTGDEGDAGMEEPGCTPACTARECGDDGCGGSCGSCATGSTCDGGRCEPVAPSANCPPTGSMGNRVGEIAPNVTLYDCDGSPVQTHATCGSPVYVYSHSESCGSCISWAQSGANAFGAQLEAHGVEFYFVIAIGRGSTPDTSLCQRVRDEYGLSMPVYYLTNPWDFAGAYGSVGAGPGALLDSDHRITTTGSAKSASGRARILDAAASL